MKTRASVKLAMIYAEELWIEDNSMWVMMGIKKKQYMKIMKNKAMKTFWITEEEAEMMMILQNIE